MVVKGGVFQLEFNVTSSTATKQIAYIFVLFCDERTWNFFLWHKKTSDIVQRVKAVEKNVSVNGCGAVTSFLECHMYLSCSEEALYNYNTVREGINTGVGGNLSLDAVWISRVWVITVTK